MNEGDLVIVKDLYQSYDRWELYSPKSDHIGQVVTYIGGDSQTHWVKLKVKVKDTHTGVVFDYWSWLAPLDGLELAFTY